MSALTTKLHLLSLFLFPFLAIGQGPMIEWEYILVSKDVIEPRTWCFQEGIPIRFNELKIRNESRISYVTLFNMGDNIPFKESYKDKTIYQRGMVSIVLQQMRT